MKRFLFLILMLLFASCATLPKVTKDLVKENVVLLDKRGGFAATSVKFLKKSNDKYFLKFGKKVVNIDPRFGRIVGTTLLFRSLDLNLKEVNLAKDYNVGEELVKKGKFVYNKNNELIAIISGGEESNLKDIRKMQINLAILYRLKTFAVFFNLSNK